jgi:hypothetical protein
LMKNELDVDKKMKLAMQIAELKKEDVWVWLKLRVLKTEKKI